MPPTTAPIELTPEADLERRSSREARCALGQFFTPEPIAEVMAEAVNDIQPEHVLDPGLGGGVLLRAVGPEPARYGVDVDPLAVDVARPALELQGGTLELVVGDFLALDAWPLSRGEFDAVISNPPYIRHHNLTPQHKALARHYSRALGVNMSSCPAPTSTSSSRRSRDSAQAAVSCSSRQPSSLTCGTGRQ